MARKFERRHYQAVAEAIKAAKADIRYKEPPGSHDDLLDGVDYARDHLSAMFKADCAGFKPEKFKEACGN